MLVWQVQKCFLTLCFAAVSLDATFVNEFGPLAQLVEQQTLNLSVRGSSPWRLTS